MGGVGTVLPVPALPACLGSKCLWWAYSDEFSLIFANAKLKLWYLLVLWFFLRHADYSFELEVLVQHRVREMGIGDAVLQIVSNFSCLCRSAVLVFSGQIRHHHIFQLAIHVCVHTCICIHSCNFFIVVLTAVLSRRNFFPNIIVETSWWFWKWLQRSENVREKTK